MPTVDLTFKADLTQLRKELEKGVGTKEARALVSELNKSIKAQERAAKKVSKAMKKAEKEAQQFKKGLEGGKQAAEAMGGKVGELAGRIEKAGQSFASFSAALGPAGPLVLGVGALAVAGAAYAAAITAVGAGIVTLIRSTDELLAKNAEFQEFFAPVDATDLQAIHDFTDATDGIAIAAEQVAIILGGQLATELADTARIALQASLAFVDFADRIDAGSIALQGLAAVFLGPAGAEAAMQIMPKALDAVDSATADYAVTAEGLTEKIRAQREAQKEAATASKAQAEAEREAAAAMREAEQAAKARASATESLNESIYRSTLAVVDPLTALEMEYERQQVQILDTAIAAGNLELGMKALAAAEIAHTQNVEEAIDAMIRFKQSANDVEVAIEDDRTALQRFLDSDFYAQMDAISMEAERATGMVTGLVSEAAAQRVDAIAAVAEAERQAIEEGADLMEASETERINRLVEIGRLTEEEGQAQIAAVEAAAQAERERADSVAAQLEQQAIKAFKLNQAAQIANATIEAARAAIALTPSFAYLSAGAPAAAAAVAGAQLALAIGAIKAQEPPSFALGGMVSDRTTGGADHTPIMASPSEGIVSPRGMSAIGREGLEAINQGAAPTTNVSVMLDRQIIASAVVDAIAGDGRAANAVRVQSGARTGQTLVYGRG
jgi:hypothetical protein